MYSNHCCSSSFKPEIINIDQSSHKMYSNHHHHHVVPLAWISLTLSRHFSLSFIASGRSSGLHPVSSHSCWIYVRAGRPAFARPYEGVHRSTSLMSTSLLLQQYPTCLVRLTWIAFMMGGRWPYSWCLVRCCRQDLFNIAGSIPMSLPSSFFSSRLVSVDAEHPYSSIDTTAAWKKLRFILSVRSDFHMIDSLLIAVHASCEFSRVYENFKCPHEKCLETYRMHLICEWVSSKSQILLLTLSNLLIHSLSFTQIHTHCFIINDKEDIVKSFLITLTFCISFFSLGVA